MRLSPTDRLFFQLVNESSTINPFCSERIDLDRKIVGGTDVPAGEALVDMVIEVRREAQQFLRDKSSPALIQEWGIGDAG